MTTTKSQLQETLFPESDADPLNPLATSVPETRRGPGRPPGALNLATKEMRDYLRANFSDPLVGRARVAMMRPQDLATALGCTLLEAFDRIEQAKEFVTRYVHQELPKALEVGGKGSFVMVIGQVGDDQAVLPAGEGGPVTIELRPTTPQANQQLSAPHPAELDKPELDK